MKAIGPTFIDEIRAAGLIGLQFCWSDDGTIDFGETITPEQRQGVLAVYAAHDPVKSTALAQTKAKLAGYDALLTDRGIRESILGEGIGIDYMRAIPLEPLPLDAPVANVVASYNLLVSYLRDFPKYGTGMDKLRQVESLCVAERDKLAPK